MLTISADARDLYSFVTQAASQGNHSSLSHQLSGPKLRDTIAQYRRYYLRDTFSGKLALPQIGAIRALGT